MIAPLLYNGGRKEEKGDNIPPGGPLDLKTRGSPIRINDQSVLVLSSGSIDDDLWAHCLKPVKRLWWIDSHV
jgi:hypothetical protein